MAVPVTPVRLGDDRTAGGRPDPVCPVSASGNNDLRCQAHGGSVRLMAVSLAVAAEGRTPALLLRPWQAADMPGLLAAMDREYPAGGLRSNPYVGAGLRRWTGPRDENEAASWLSGQDRGWQSGDWLALAVVGRRGRVVGQVGLMNREGGRVGDGGFAEISYWTAADARGLGIAPAAVRAMTRWAFGSFGSDGLPLIMLVHDLDNPESCRVAGKSGYEFSEISPANPPLWYSAGHVHVAVSRLGMPMPASLLRGGD
jgi:RimJ/RimL family protein N-acetyltransferase